RLNFESSGGLPPFNYTVCGSFVKYTLMHSYDSVTSDSFDLLLTNNDASGYTELNAATIYQSIAQNHSGGGHSLIHRRTIQEIQIGDIAANADFDEEPVSIPSDFDDSTGHTYFIASIPERLGNASDLFQPSDLTALLAIAGGSSAD